MKVLKAITDYLMIFILVAVFIIGMITLLVGVSGVLSSDNLERSKCEIQKCEIQKEVLKCHKGYTINNYPLKGETIIECNEE